MKAIRLKTEYMTNPRGIDIPRPRLTWLCQDGLSQTAYEISAWDESGTLWESGKVSGSRMAAFYGAEPKSRQTVFWKLRLWDEKDQPGPWSETAFFETGLLERKDFIARWIDPEPDRDPEAHKPASYLRKRFSIEEDFRRARLYISCHGLYEAHLNGKRAGNFVLAPGVSSYAQRLAYQTYDVTELLCPGDNEVQVILGDGWYRSCSGVDGDRNLFGKDVALWFQLELDGRAVCLSDESWEASQEGPLRENDMQQGEIYDGRIREIGGWHPVRIAPFGTDNLCASNCVPILEQERFPGRLFTTPDGATVIDYGQNLAGYIELTVNAREGDTLVLTHGETLDENGNFTQENFQDRDRHKEGGTRQQVVYTCREGLNHYKTRFSIWGFRYAKLETNADLSEASFTAIAVYSEMERLGRFACGNPLVERLVENTVWSMKSNFCDVPTDCPTRERAAWTGDMGIFAETGLYLADCYPVIRKWLGECRLNQYPDGKVANIAPKNNRPTFTTELLAGSVGWGDASILVPWALYDRFDDLRILEENADMMRRWYAYLESRAGQKTSPTESLNPDNIPEQYRAMLANLPKEALAEMMKKFAPPAQEENPWAEYAIETGTDYGEWCEPDTSSIQNMGKPQSKVATAYYAKSGGMLAEISGLLNDPEGTERYARISEGAKRAFRFLAAKDGRIRSDRQAEYVRAISFDLLSEEEKRQAAADLNDLVIRCGYHLNTGFLSTPQLCPVLADYGYTETAYRLLLQDTCPSWLYAVQKGATTIWENWDGVNEKGEVKASLNHYSYGAVCGWLFSGVCGIRVTGSRIQIAPRPHPLLGRAEASYLSPLGEIVSGWQYGEDGKLTFHIQIPANAEAELSLPDGRREALTAGEYWF
ncbi:MAG: glycoside hydrolase family 78 protein [Roseburia sp.]|nr:glycoside hydrolase family 78 protein [Roseburia sp.]MCM1098459.1 glycoside hydrolase family 78 protein [Ruminococcus flavefaciens]